MSLSLCARLKLVALGWAVAFCGPALPLSAQEEPAAPPSQPFRKLAPGVLRDVDPARQVEETNSRHDHLGLIDVNADFEWAKNVSFRHDVWHLDIRYKPVRTIWVDIPQKNGAMQRKLIWYLVYSVTNPGETMHPVPQGDGTYQIEMQQKDVRFVPEFLLRDHETNQVSADTVIPVALGPIRLREDAKRRFLNTAEMIREIKVGETFWGVATWENLDPRIDRFSVYVKGLTNAYKWKDDQEAYVRGEPVSGRKLGVKTLKLNFWRPGDEYSEDRDLIRAGVPGGQDYEWVYLY